jgi:uncharacterized membrane protein HdeD (DUF308 family)
VRRPALRWVALGLFGLAAIVFTLLELTVPGLILLFSSIVLGVFAIATPELLAVERDEPDR